jgi:hypothetical protein
MQSKPTHVLQKRGSQHNVARKSCRMPAMGLGRVKTSEEDAGYEVQDWASQAAIAAMSGLIPTMFMTRVRL